jgi:PKD repeat protein
MSENNPDVGADESRREFLRIAAATGILAGTGGIGVNKFTGKALASTAYQNHHEGFFSSYGDLIDSSYASGGDVEPYSVSSDVGTDACMYGADTECDGGGGGGGSSTPTPTSTPRPTSEPNDGPVANISTDPHVAIDISTSFSGSSSYDSDGSISSYHWDFGDGSTASGESVTYTYADTGKYTVTLTVVDNDGASDTDSATVTVGNQWEVNLDFEDGTTIVEEALEIGDGIWETISDGERFVSEITQAVKDAVDDFLAGSLGDADAQFQYPTIKSPKSIDMTSGSSHTIEGNEVDVGDAWVGGVLPDWALANVPVVERTYADWENGLAEAAATSTVGASYGMSVVCAEFTPSLSATTSGYVTVNYDWSVHLFVVGSSADVYVSPFVRNVTEGVEEMVDDVHYAKDLFAFDLEGNSQLPATWYGEGVESYTFAMMENDERELRLKDGHEYQVGVRLIVNTAAYDLHPALTGRALAVDQTTNHVNPVGDKSLRDSSPSGMEDDIQNGVNVNSIDIEW